MKEITRIEKVYDFNELSDTAKENARMKYRENFRESYMFTEICEEKMKEDFPNSKLEVQYSLSYCQGDGLNVYGNFAISDIIRFVKEKYEDYNELFNKQEKRFADYLEKQDIEITNRCNNHYSYYISKADDIRYYVELEMEGNYYRDIPYNTIECIANMFNDCFKKYCKEMEDDGYSFFYEVEDEEIIETWEANEYLGFTESGEPVYL